VATFSGIRNIPRIGEKLSYMGPGDALVDTDLEALTKECTALDRGAAQPKTGECA